jgi:hypothetical protein
MKSFDQTLVSFLKNNLHVAHSPRRDPCEIGNFFPNINVLSFWQICQTLVLAAGDLVGKGLRMETCLLFKR